MTLRPGIARSESIGAFRRVPAVSIETNRWVVERALRYDIGWFDYASADEPLESSGDSDGLGLNSVLPKGNLLRDLAVTLQPPIGALASGSNILEWPSPLLQYQREGVMALITRPALLLADSMGLGKTIQSIAALRILYHRSEIQSALVVCPAGLVAQWRSEFARWAPELTVVPVQGSSTERGRLWRVPAHVRLIGYETLRGDVLDVRDSPALRQTLDVVVLDEASRIKNGRSGIAVACKLLPAERRWALTGTPVENSLEDAVSILDFLVNNQSVGRHRAQITANGSDVKAQLRAYQLRRRREDVLPQLPSKRVNEITIELPPAQRAVYDRAEQDGIIQLTGRESTTIVHVLELISRLKQICNYDPASGESGKLADISERMTELVSQGDRALIFSQFVDDMFGIGRLAHHLKPYNPLSYTGSLTMQQRTDAVAKFLKNSDHKVLLLSLRAGGQGLNLQAASFVFHLDRWWNPAVEEQAESRAHRMGQTKPVTIYRYICANTIEERIDAKLREKRRIFQDAVDDATLDISKMLTESEVFGLLGLGKPR